MHRCKSDSTIVLTAIMMATSNSPGFGDIDSCGGVLLYPGNGLVNVSYELSLSDHSDELMVVAVL